MGKFKTDEQKKRSSGASQIFFTKTHYVLKKAGLKAPIVLWHTNGHQYNLTKIINCINHSQHISIPGVEKISICSENNNLSQISTRVLRMQIIIILKKYQVSHLSPITNLYIPILDIVNPSELCFTWQAKLLHTHLFFFYI